MIASARPRFSAAVTNSSNSSSARSRCPPTIAAQEDRVGKRRANPRPPPSLRSLLSAAPEFPQRQRAAQPPFGPCRNRFTQPYVTEASSTRPGAAGAIDVETSLLASYPTPLIAVCQGQAFGRPCSTSL